MKSVKNCLVCGIEFTPHRTNSVGKYCSRACTDAARRIIKTCPVCGKAFRPSRAEYVVCSRACAMQRRKGIPTTPRQERICQHCGKPFGADRKPSSTSGQRYCSPECFNASKKEQRSCPTCGKVFVTSIAKPLTYCCHRCADDAKIRAVSKACPVCGKVFSYPPSRKAKFCSRECEYNSRPQHNQRIMRGKNWKGQRTHALRRDGYRCCICGCKAKRYEKRTIDVHHIRPYRLFNGDYLSANALTNLITLCRQCHVKVERYGFPCPQPLF